MRKIFFWLKDEANLFKQKLKLIERKNKKSRIN